MATGFGEQTGLLFLGCEKRQSERNANSGDIRDSRLSWCSAGMVVGVEPFGMRRDMAPSEMRVR